MNFDKLEAELMRDEGFVGHAYQDHLGYWTIGYGRLIDKRRGGGISKNEAKDMLRADMLEVYQSLREKIEFFDGLSDKHQRALCNMAFQLGVGGLLKFKKMLTAMSIGHFDRAHIEALDSKWAEQTPERAMRVAYMIKNG